MNSLSECGEKLARLRTILANCGPRVVACSGGLDSMLLAYLAHCDSPEKTLIAHAGSVAVPSEAGLRLQSFAAYAGWNLIYVKTSEHEDESYLKNPKNRCYFCKKHLYETLTSFNREILSGTNLDDLGEYRPGLEAAKERSVRHPYVEAGLSKEDLRAISRELSLPFSELPASPCLASRLYTGTRVTGRRLALVDEVETLIREKASIAVVRARLKERSMLIEVISEDRAKITDSLMSELQKKFLFDYSDVVESITLDAESYRPGRSFVVLQ